MRNISLSKTCTKLDTSRSTIYRMLGRNEFPQPIRMGRRISFIEEEVDAWLEARRQARTTVAK